MKSIHESDGISSSPLTPEDFTFFGFGSLPREELRRISRLTIRRGPCNVSFVANGLLDPGTEDRVGKSSRRPGGVYDSDGVPVDAAGIQRKGGKKFGPSEAISVTEVPRVDEDVIYLGPLFNHYGRILLETLARAWYLNEPEAAMQRVAVSTGNAAHGEIASWIPPLLHAFGIPSQRLLVTSRVTRFRQIAVPEPLFEQSHAAHVQMVEPFQQVARDACDPASSTDQPLYLSRLALSSRQRPIIGEAELERILRDCGARIVYPEMLPFSEQVRLFNTHRDIFSPVGSAAHSILFATIRPHLHLLSSRDDIPANYFLCSALAQTPTTFVNCVTSAMEASDREYSAQVGERRGSHGRGADPYSGLQSRPQKLEIEPFVEYLRGQGFLKQAYRPLSPTDRLQLDADFDEAWAYSRLRKAAGKSTALAGDVEANVARLSTTSWPVSLMLARYFSRLEDAEKTQEMSLQFLDLVAKETNEARLRHFQADAVGIVQRLKRHAAPEVRTRLSAAVERHWPSSPENLEDA